jgi:hypothetical protein
MKTEAQIKKEVINYLEKTSMHTFLKPKATFKWGNQNTPGYYEYDYENGTYFKVFKEGEDWFKIDEGKIGKIGLDWFYENNTKCVTRHRLFLGKNMKSIKNTKFVKSQIELIRNPQK